MKKLILPFTLLSLLFCAGCVSKEASISREDFSGEIAQAQVDQLYDLLDKQSFPKCYSEALNRNRNDMTKEEADFLVTSYKIVGRYLDIQFLPELLIKTWDSEDPVIQLSTNSIVLLDYSVIDSPFIPRDNTCFDPNEYFKVLNSITNANEYTLDYVYWASGGNGRPMLYGRKNGAPPLPSSDLLKFLTEENPTSQNSYLPYMKAVALDGSEQSYFELALLEILGEQFYLGWHANYNDTVVICSSSGLDRFLSDSRNFMRSSSEKEYYLPEEIQSQARKLDVSPSVSFDNETVNVHLTCFSNWEWFYRRELIFEKESPHKLLSSERNDLVKYDCGIMF